MKLRLGKAPARIDTRTLHAARFMQALPARPRSVLYGSRLSWPMYANDQYGDCTIAAKWHMIEAWTRGYKTTDAKIIAEYMRLSGGADDGLVMLDVLNDWRRATQNPIHAYGLIDHRDPSQVSDGVYLFGGAYLGVGLPAYIDQRMRRGSWDWSIATPNDKGSYEPWSWGGHAVNVVGYSTTGVQLVTWGRRVKCSWQFLEKYADELFCVISKDWLGSTGKDRHGFNQAQLDADLAAI